MTSNYSTHVFSLSALFVLGMLLDALFYDASLLYFLFTVIFALCSHLLVKHLFKFIKKSKLINGIVAWGIRVIAIAGVLDGFLNLFKFVKIELLPKNTNMSILIALITVVIAFSIAQDKAICKYSLVAFSISVIIIALCFIIGVKNFNPYSPELSLSLRFEIWRMLLKTMPIVILPFFAHKQNCNLKFVLWGVGAGVLALCVCIAQTMFTLVNVDKVYLPYLKSVSVISAGSLFTRLDGLVYFLFFVASLVKITVCVKMLKIK